MPYQWLPPEGRIRRLHLWPHRSLSQRGFVAFIGCTAALVALPLLAVLGSPVLWGLLPFLALTLAAIWFALRKNGRDRDLLEILELSPEALRLIRHAPRQPSQSWQANPYWVRLEVHLSAGPVPYYLSLSGGAERKVEIGAFLSEAERRQLQPELEQALALARHHPG